MFNTLMYAKKLEEAGVSRLQAEAHVQIIAEIVEGDLATKSDIRELKYEMQQLEYRLIIKLGAVVTAIITAAVTILKLT
jgi:hypothetical protein